MATIFRRASEKLGDQINQSGTVPPRVVKAIVDEGSFCDQIIQQDYYAGILASSRGEKIEDDRGVRIANQISELSNYQTRAHFIIYKSVKDIFAGKGFTGGQLDRWKLQLFFPYNGRVLEAFGIDPGTPNMRAPLLNHIMFGLHKDALIDDFQYGPLDHISPLFDKAALSELNNSAEHDQSGGLVVTPSVTGIELFLWAHGKGNMSVAEFLSDEQLPPFQGMDLTLPKSFRTQADDS